MQNYLDNAHNLFVFLSLILVYLEIILLTKSDVVRCFLEKIVIIKFILFRTK